MVNQRVVSAAHWEHDGAYATYAGQRDFPESFLGDYHIFVLEWTPTNITTYVNDTQVWTMDIDSSSCIDCEEFHKPHFVVLNMAVGGGFTSGSGSSSSGSSGSSGCGSSSQGDGCGPLRGPDDITAPLPATMYVDWVRVYDNGYTELTVTPVPAAAPTHAPMIAEQPAPVPAPVPEPVPAPVPAPVETPMAHPTNAPVSPSIPTPPPVTLPTTSAPVPTVYIVEPPAESPPSSNIIFPQGKSGKGKSGKSGSGSGAGAAAGGSSAKTSGKAKNARGSGGILSSEQELALNSGSDFQGSHALKVAVLAYCLALLL